MQILLPCGQLTKPSLRLSESSALLKRASWQVRPALFRYLIKEGVVQEEKASEYTVTPANGSLLRGTPYFDVHVLQRGFCRSAHCRVPYAAVGVTV